MHDGSDSPYSTVALEHGSVTTVHQFSESGELYYEISLTYQKITFTWVDGGVTTEDDLAGPI